MKLEEKVILAALLHDIGKVRERFERGQRQNHALLTREFLKKFDEELAELAYGHHSGKELDTLSDVREELQNFAEIISRADNISAGVERTRIPSKVKVDEEGTQKEKETLEGWTKRDRKERPMLSVLSTVDLEKGGSKEKYFTVRELTLEPFYLKPKKLEESAVDYSFWSKMEEDIGSVWGKYDFKRLIFTISNILKKYLFFVPADTYESYGKIRKIPIPDTSLYEHSRLTSIFTLVMLEDKTKFMLIKGDISGIQDFIARITSKRALRFLKGRSFFLELLNLAAAFRICRDLGIPYTQILSATAGNFTIIAPATNDCRKALERIKKDINRELINYGLYIAIAWREFNYEEAQNFNQLVRKLDDDLDILKLKRYHEIVEEDYELVFGTSVFGTSTEKLDECDVCKIEVKKENLRNIGVEETATEEEKIEVCSSCYEIYQLSDKLIKIGRIISETKGRAKFYIGVYENGGGDITLLGIGFKIDALPEGLVNADYVFVANNVDFLEDEFVKNGIGCGFRFFNVNVAETSIDDLSESSKGAKYVGILKMDGDDMGKIFSEGVRNWWKKKGISEEVEMTPGRYATMSSLFEIFFGYCVDRICREGKFFTKKSFAEDPKIYVVFSGGDDLFVIGPWDQIIDLAIKINEEYLIFTGNPNMTISAAITLAERKFPVYKSYSMTLESLEDAKSFEDKSAVSLFYNKIRFGDIQEVKKIKNFLVDRIEEGDLSRAIIYALLSSINNGGKYRRKWAAKYVIARYSERYGDLSFLDEKIDEAFKENSFSKLLVALKWAELLTREVVG